MRAIFLGAAIGACLWSGAHPAGAVDLSRPDSHAPIGVMGDHTHRAGEWMLSARSVFMDMHGSRDGSESVSAGEVLQDYPVTPTQMKMSMQMLGLMYAPSDQLTLMAMVPFVRKNMDHVTRTGARFTTASEGFGDFRLGGMWVLAHGETQQLHLNFGVSVPTGSTREVDRTPMGRSRIPYPMQLGSGTYDLRPGLTYQLQAGGWSLGAQALGTLRLGEDRRGYRLGNVVGGDLWGSVQVAPGLSASLRVHGERWGDIDGADPGLNPAVVPTADPSTRGGRRVDVAVGVNWLFGRGPLRGHRIAVEWAVPVYESDSGPQLETDWILTMGWQKGF